MKYIIWIGLILTSLTLKVNGQVRGEVKLKNDTVYHRNRPAFLCVGQTKLGQSLYFLTSLDKKPQAAIVFNDLDSQIRCTARFTQFLLRYDVLYPKIDISVLMESFIKNKVMVNGQADSLGIVAYCKERDIKLSVIRGQKMNRPVYNDSVMAQKAKEDMAAQINFTIENTSENQFKISIGSAATNRTQLINAGTVMEEHARPGEKVCVLDNKGEIVKSCLEVKKESKKFLISKEGKLTPQ
jgi:hypothetical protein